MVELILKIQNFTEEQKGYYQKKLDNHNCSKQDRKFLTSIHLEHMASLDKFANGVIEIIKVHSGIPITVQGKFNTYPDYQSLQVIEQ